MEFEKLCEIIEDVLHLGDRAITPETTFVEDLGADSLDQFEIYLAVGKTFEIEVSDEAAARIVTVGDLLDIIRSTKSGI